MPHYYSQGGSSIIGVALRSVIVYPTQDSVKRFGPLISLLTVWLVSLLLASPLAVFNVISKLELFDSIVLYETCVENEDLETQRRAYSLASIIFQYLLPVVTVSVAHARISHKLRNRMVTLQQRNEQSTSTSAATTAEGGGRATVTVPRTAAQKEKRRLALQRKRKTNLLLVMIAAVFALSWLPLNICNILTDFNMSLFQRVDSKFGGLAYPICHLLVLGSACFNPLLYGWLNDNFRREFVKALCCCSPAARASARAGAGATMAGGTRANGGGGRSMATSAVGGVRPSRRRRPSQLSADGDIELQQPHAERHVEDSVNDEEQLKSLVNE